MRAIRVHSFGAPDVLVAETVANPQPAAGQVVIDVCLAGVGYGDVIVRSGRYPLPLPWIPGIEVGGQVIAVGPDVDESLLGTTVVATTAGQAGGYAEQAVATAAYTFPVPDGLALDVALAVFQAGALARGLLSAMRLRAEDTVLVTAAAGRIGSLLVQTAKAAGATVIGAASSTKLAAVTEFGADHAIDYGAAGWKEQVREVTGGRGVTLALDAVGGQTAVSVLTAAADGAGRVGLYGYASGDWPSLTVGDITTRTSTSMPACKAPPHSRTPNSTPEQTRARWPGPAPPAMASPRAGQSRTPPDPGRAGKSSRPATRPAAATPRDPAPALLDTQPANTNPAHRLGDRSPDTPAAVPSDTPTTADPDTATPTARTPHTPHPTHHDHPSVAHAGVVRVATGPPPWTQPATARIKWQPSVRFPPGTAWEAGLRVRSGAGEHRRVEPFGKPCW